jgi:hypothetical protein
MIESTFNSCLLHISQIEFINYFEIVDLQTDDTLILADDEFAALKESELARAHLTSKKREKLNLIISIKSNDELIILADNDKFLLLIQSKQFDQIMLINLSFSINLTSSRISTSLNEHEMLISQRSRNSKRSLIFLSLLRLSISKRKTRSDWINVYNDR